MKNNYTFELPYAKHTHLERMTWILWPQLLVFLE